MARIDSFLRVVVEQSASDLHFHAGSPPTIRWLGDLVPLPFRSLAPEETERFLLEIMNDVQKKAFQEDQEVDFAYVLPGAGRFRVNAFHQQRGAGAVFRVIPEEVPTCDTLRLPPAVRGLADLSNGLVLVTGPTGSGKTTTLAAIVHEINRLAQRHVITIEDPIEYVHTSLRSLVTQRELGTHTTAAASALRAALRESPDVVVVGELRDFETISLALSAAETGVLVLGTLHTNSAAKAIDRLVSACPDEVQPQVVNVVSLVLRAVVAQHLCKRATGDGRVAALEVLLQSHAVSNLIREGKFHQIDTYLRGDGAQGGCQHLDGAVLTLVREGAITLEEGLLIANDPDAVRSAIEALRGSAEEDEGDGR